MGRIRFSLDQLEVLEAIERFGSFALAAKHTHRTTSSVSYAVKALESAVGVTLFERTGRSAKLTERGQLILDAGRDVIARARRLETLGADLEGGVEPELRLVLDGVIDQEAIVRACTRFLRRKTRATNLFTCVEYLSGVSRRFDQEEAHFMISVGGEVARDPRFVTHSLRKIEMVLVAHSDHPLHHAATGVPIDRGWLGQFVEVLVADSGARNAAPPNLLAKIGSSNVFELSDFDAKRRALVSGLGFGWLPLPIAKKHLQRSGRGGGGGGGGGSRGSSRALKRIAFEEGNRYTLEPLLAYRRDRPLGPAGRMLLDDLLAELARA